MITTLHQALKAKQIEPPELVIETSFRHDIDDLVASVLAPMKLTIVDDRHTSDAFGDQIFRALKGRFACTHVTLAGTPSLDEETVQYLRMQTLSSDALVAVGSGTINDLCKYVSALDRKPYIVFPTAASMNGYCSANASISIKGHKKTVAAQLPRAVFCDLSVIADAPERLNKSGLGDSLARPTSQADWLLSHLVLDTEYDASVFEPLTSLEPELFDQARGIALGDPQSIRLLINVLLHSGLGMALAGGSYPASQGEHMIAHAYGMLPQAGRSRPTLHGEEVGVTTLTMARLQEEMLRGKPVLRDADFPEDKVISVYGDAISSEAKKAFQEKSERMKNVSLSRWQGIAEKITSITLPSARLQTILEAAETPTTPELLGWNNYDYGIALGTARFLRERFTFLDLSPG